jgi:endonuclease/exonuclease/phosphatase family metal-dependent hydrolase
MQAGSLDSRGLRRPDSAAPRVASFARGAARLVVAAAATCAVGLASAFAFAGEGAWWAELARYVPYLAYLVPAMAAAGLSLLLGWRWRIAALATLSLVLGPVMGLTVNIGDSGSGRLRVMTYNIKDYVAQKRPGGFAAIAWEIALHDSDIVLMQDAENVAELHLEHPNRAAKMFGGRQVATSGQFIIASRFPLRGCKDGDVSFPGERHHYQRCTVLANGVEFELFNVHLLTPREGLNATRHERLAGIDEWKDNVASRVLQARALARDVAASPRPVVLMGDLNAPQHSPVVGHLLGTGLRDAFSTAGVGYGYTHGHSLRPHISFARIDHVLVSPKFGIAEAYVGGKEASEHRPVVTDLWLKRE